MRSWNANFYDVYKCSALVILGSFQRRICLNSFVDLVLSRCALCLHGIMQMSSGAESQLADELHDLDLAGCDSDSELALSLAVNEAAAHDLTQENAQTLARATEKLTMDEAATEELTQENKAQRTQEAALARAQAETEKSLAYERALDRIESQKAQKAKKVKRKRSQLPEANRYKRPKLRKEDGSGADIRYRPTINEKVQILQFRYGTPFTEGHTVRETIAKFDKVTHCQLKKWKKQ